MGQATYITQRGKYTSGSELSITVHPMSAAPPRLSKSRYLSGLQCHKQLWWRVHEPEAPELSPSPGGQNLFAQGREVGEHARGHLPGGELIDLPDYQYDHKVAATRQALNPDLPA